MGAYLFNIEMQEFSNELLAQIPDHRRYVNRMFAEGRILSYSVSQSRSNIWVVVNAEDEADAMDCVAKMPLFAFFVDVTCHPLLFHNTMPSMMPGISLN